MDFNSSEYAWKDIEVVMLGRPLVRILETSYKVATEQIPLYGRGQKVLDINEGNESVSGSLKIGQSELEALIRKSKEYGASNPTHLPKLDLVISYARNGIIIIDVVQGVKFQEFDKAMAQGAGAMEVTLPYIAMDVELNRNNV